MSHILGLISVFWVFYLGVSVLAIVAKWTLYEKAGEPGWATVVPFYNNYVLFKLSWGNGWYFLLTSIPAFLTGITFSIFYVSLIGRGIIASYTPGFNTYAGNSAMAYNAIWLVLLLSLLGLGILAVNIIAAIKLARAFGQNGGFAVGLILLNLIFICILAFSKDIVYLGVPGKTSPNGTGRDRAHPNAWQPVYSTPHYQPQDWQEAACRPSDRVGYCTACGTQLRRDDRFCSNCGKPQ